MTLSQILFHQQTIFAIFIYCVSVVIALFVFSFLHIKSNNIFTRSIWEIIGLPLMMAFLMIGFIFLAYPINFGIEQAPSISELLNIDDKRSNFLINMVFLLTFFFPLIPVIGKWEELIIPLQGILASIIIFSWLCQGLGIKRYSLFPDFKTIFFIIIISIITHWIAKYFSAHLGGYLDKLYHREGFQILIFKAVILIMQSPVIFIFGIHLGKQLSQ
jgi:hypothetical protein